jgi:type IV pilus assembly protein PilB
LSQPPINDQKLALTLVQAGLLSAPQIHAAAQQRTPDKNLAQVILDNGWLSEQQLARFTTLTNGVKAPSINQKGFAAPPPSNVGLGQDGPVYLNSSGVVFDDDELATDDEEEVSEAVQISNQLLQQAVAMRASDLHLQPQQNGLLPRFRVDGRLTAGRLIERELQPSVTSRIKLMAQLNIAETRLSQDGRFRALVGGRRIDFRLSTLPGIYGEKLVLRLLDPTSLVTDLSRLGFTVQTRERFEKMLRRAHGMILVTGPTGSGKTTTLYAALSATRDESKNIVTVEDPVEYELSGIMQCNVQPEIGNSFAARLRSILRQDPDVILVGEIRDTETAEMAVRAALTGHLVLSTLHTNSAAAAVARLQDMGMEPFLIASSLAGVLAQRLVRLICRNCRQPLNAESEEYKLALATWKLPQGSPLFRGVGCAECNGRGMKGRLAVMELLEFDESIRRAIMNREDADAIQRIAVAGGMKTLYQDGIEKLQAGLTTSEELSHAIFAE